MGKQVMVQTKNLTKSYGDFTAVNQLNLCVEEGEVFGFLGPNGAGKTTTILMLLGLTEPTSGMAQVCGYNPTREALKVKRIAGYLPENVGFYEDLTARQNLRYIARLNHLPDEQASRKINEVLERVGLAKAADQQVGQFSRGMKQRLGIADILVKEPRIVFLDEPTMGIDPDGVSHTLDIIVSMSREQGITVILSSHLLHQVQRICDRVGILARGRMVAQGPIERLGREMPGGDEMRIEVQASETSRELIESIKQIRGVRKVEKSGHLLLISAQGEVRPEISKAVVDSGASLLRIRLQDYALEEIYSRYFHEG